MTVEETTASSPEELVVSVELANALIELLGIEEGSSRMSSVVLASGLVGAGLAGIKGLTAHSRLTHHHPGRLPSGRGGCP